jgi:hypothetical protein
MHDLPSFYSMANLFLSALFYYFLHISLIPFTIYIWRQNLCQQCPSRFGFKLDFYSDSNLENIFTYFHFRDSWWFFVRANVLDNFFVRSEYYPVISTNNIAIGPVRVRKIRFQPTQYVFSPQENLENQSDAISPSPPRPNCSIPHRARALPPPCP